MRKYVAIGVGGVLGSLARYSFVMMMPAVGGVMAIALVNVLGAFLLGFLGTKRLALRRTLYLGMTTGFLGAFTTFSTLCLTIDAGLARHTAAALVLSGLSVALGLAAAAAGGWLGRGVPSLPATDVQETSL